MSTYLRVLIRLFVLVFSVAGCGSAARPIGDPCSSSDPCGGGEYCQLASPGGECSAICEEGDDLEDCGAGNVCAKIATGSWECKKGCAADTQCRTGYACTGSQGMAKYCVKK